VFGPLMFGSYQSTPGRGNRSDDRTQCGQDDRPKPVAPMVLVVNGESKMTNTKRHSSPFFPATARELSASAEVELASIRDTCVLIVDAPA